MTAKVVNRIANAYKAKITLLNVVDHEEDVESTKAYLDKSAAKFDQWRKPLTFVRCRKIS